MKNFFGINRTQSDKNLSIDGAAFLSGRVSNLQKKQIYVIIERSRVKRRVYIIFKRTIKYYTKESCKLFSIMAVALGLIIAIILLKYRPIYKVTLGGQEIGYVEDEAKLKERIQQEIIEMEGI